MRPLLRLALAAGALWLLTPGTGRAASSDVAVGETAFTPSEITIQIGDSVVWTNQSNGYHTVTIDGFDDPYAACIPATGIGCMAPGDQFEEGFDIAGRFAYHCRVHNGMAGTVVVLSGQTTSSTTTTTSSTATTTTSPTTSTTPPDQSTVTQAPLPSVNPNTRAALPKPVARNSTAEDDLRPWVLLDVAIVGTTVIAGVVLVRKGRVPFG